MTLFFRYPPRFQPGATNFVTFEKGLIIYQHLQRGAKWFIKGSILHFLGFNWHPFEGPGK